MLADVYQLGQDGPAPLALLWHGIGTADRDVLEPLAAEAARPAPARTASGAAR